MITKTLKFLFIPIALMVASPTVWAQPGSCSSVHQSAMNTFHPLNAVPAYDRSANEMIAAGGRSGEKSPQAVKAWSQHAMNIHGLLKDVFYPVVFKAADDIQKLSPAQIRMRTKSALSNIEVKTAQYQNSPPTMEYFVQGEKLQNSQVAYLPEADRDHYAARLLIQNGSEGINRFSIFENPGSTAYYTQEYLWAKSPEKFVADYGNVFQVLGLTLTPVSHYGKSFSESLLRTTRAFMHLLNTDPAFHEIARKTFSVNRLFLMFTTARGSEQSGTKPLSAAASIQEGVVSLHQFFTLMLDQRLDGAPSGRQALHDLIFKPANSELGLVADFTSRLPMGLIGPMTLTGLRFQKPLARTADGKIDMSEQLKSALRQLSEEFNRTHKKPKSRCPMAALWKKVTATEDANPHAAETFTSPAQPGLQKLAEAYWHVYESLNP